MRATLRVGSAFMTFVLFIMALAGALAAIRLWVEARAGAEVLRRANAALEARIVEHEAALKAALAAVEAKDARIAAAERTRAAFLTGLSGALRPPLGALSGFCQLLRLNAGADPLSRRQDQALARMEAAAAVLLALADEVSDFAAAQGPNPALSMQRVDLRLAARQACDGLAETARAAGVTLDCPPPAVGLGVAADPLRLRQILRRLVADAIRHAPPGGTVRIEIGRTRDGVAVRVHDAGRPAPRDGLGALFQPFAALARDAPPGAGLGMAAAQRLAEAMDGRIIATHRPEGGVVFTFHLPAAAPAPRGARDAVVLYVADAAADVALMRQAASTGEGFQLHVATTGPEGLVLAQALGPDVIVLDVGLPGLDALDLKARLGADPVLHATPVVALSAACRPEDAARERAAGFAARLDEPLDIAALIAVLGELSAGSEAAPAAA